VRLATIRLGAGPGSQQNGMPVSDATVAVRVDAGQAVELAEPDVGSLLARPDWRQYAAAADGERHAVAGLDYAPLVIRPGKVICVGLNYRQHITEMGRPIPQYPTLFAKYAEALIGAADPIMLPRESEQLDWEAELGVVVARAVRHASLADAADAIGGYTVANDVTARDWQYRSPQWLQGKTFEATTPLGPWLVTPDEADPGGDGLLLSCRVGTEVVQQAKTSDLVFGAADPHPAAGRRDPDRDSWRGRPRARAGSVPHGRR
jgi:acylpyruvate hydrolase